MLGDLLLNIGASIIYDFGKAIKSKTAKNETVQTVLKQLGTSPNLHDFPDRYVEALVEFRFLEKDAVVMAFFREESIGQVFFNFYYGEKNVRNSEAMLWRAIAHCVEALKVGDDVKAKNVDVTAEIEQFWEVFKQKVHESRTVKEVEVEQTLEYLKNKTSDIHELLLAFQSILKAQGKSDIQIADKIYNIDKIDTALFGSLLEKPARLLTNPPFNTDLFIGRENDLNAIETQYQAQHRLLVLVNGEGGIGKTTLAAKYWYAHAERYKHLAWLYADTGIGAALVTLRNALGVHFEQDDDTEAQVRRIAVAINNLDTPCLLVFDNANDATDLKKYYTTLCQLPNCHILLTSRVRKLADMQVHEVRPLAKAEAVTLFKHYYPELPDADLPILHDVLKAVGYNTLVTELLAKNMAVFNRFTLRYTLADLLRDLQEKGLLALKNKTVAVVYGSEQLREAEPKDIIAAMYDLAQLRDAERHVLSNLAVLSAENIAYALLTTLLRSDEEILEHLGSLEEKGWLEYRKADSTFKISPVIQEVTRMKNAERLLEDCRTLVDTLITGLNNDKRHSDNYQQATVFARLGAAVIYALPVDADVAYLSQNIGNYHKDTGNLALMLQSYQKMLDILTALCAAEPDNAHFKNGLAISYEKLGETHSSLGNLDKALEFFETYNRLEEELYAADPQNVDFKNGLAISYQHLGETHSRLGNIDKALGFFEEFNKLGQELYAADPQNVAFKNGLSVSYQHLGLIHSSLGNRDKVLEFFEDSNQLIEELYAAYPQNVAFKNGLAISYQYLGDTHSRLGNLDKALGFFEACNRLEKELYAAYPQNVEFKNGLAVSYQHLGLIHSSLSNLDKVLKFFEEYNRLEEELYAAYPQNVSFKNGLAVSYQYLGMTHCSLGNLDKALGFFEKYNRLEEELYATYPQNVTFKSGLAVSYCQLAEISRAQNDNKKAKAYFQSAEKLWLELVRDAPQHVEFQKFLGKVQAEIKTLD